MTKLPRRQGIRWWPAVVIVLGTTATVAVLRRGDSVDRQAVNIGSVVVVIVGLLLLAAWWTTVSRASLRARAAGVLAGGVLVVAAAATVRYRGVTGDLVPLLEWRWSGERPIETTSNPTGSAAPAATVEGLSDYPQFFGPRRDGKLIGPELARDWSASPPVELWRRAVGAGWSGFAVAGGRAVTQEQRGDEELVVCYDVLTGQSLWSDSTVTRYSSPLAGVGPRATPTIVGDHVYTLGGNGALRCLELTTGAAVWSKDLVERHRAPIPEWGFAGSPLVAADLVIVPAGGAIGREDGSTEGRSLVAYDRRTGELEWAAGSESLHWSSPVLGELGSVRQVLMFNASVVAHDLATGEVLWSYPWQNDHPHVCMPVVIDGDRVLVSSGYGTGSQLLRIAPNGDVLQVTPVWRSMRMKAKFTNLVVHDGHVYGLDDGTLACMELATGERRWKSGRYGHGQIILVGSVLLVTTEQGEVVLVEAIADEPRELTRFRAFEGKSWNPPALAGEYLLLRTDREAVCYRLPVK